MVVPGGKEGGWESCGEGGGEGEGASAPGLRQVPITRRLLKKTHFLTWRGGSVKSCDLGNFIPRMNGDL